MRRRLLLVEGKDDQYVVEHLCIAHKIARDAFDIEQVKGDSKSGKEGEGVEYLIDQVPVRLKGTDIERLAVIVDADTDASSRWAQLRDRLRREGYENIPDSPGEQGTIVDFPSDFGHVRLGVWIMPNNRLPGMLEDFLAFLVPESDKTLSHVDRFLDSIPPNERKFTDTHRPKARIHSYLAVQEQPGKPLGLSITCRYLDASHEVANPFLKWIRDVLITDGTQP